MFEYPETELKLRGVSLTDADARQAFMDILAKDVIRPLEILKVSKGEYLVLAGIPGYTNGPEGHER